MFCPRNYILLWITLLVCGAATFSMGSMGFFEGYMDTHQSLNSWTQLGCESKPDLDGIFSSWLMDVYSASHMVIHYVLTCFMQYHVEFLMIATSSSFGNSLVSPGTMESPIERHSGGATLTMWALKIG